jgi:type I restriction enzyme S subunit
MSTAPNTKREVIDMPDSELPEGWCKTSLEAVTKLESGSGFPEKYQGKTDLSYPFFKVGNLGEVQSGQPLRSSAHTIDDRLAKILHAKIIPPDAVVFAKIGMAIRLNRRRLTGVPCCIDNNMMAAIPTTAILPRFLLRFLETVPFMELTTATTVPSLRKSELEQVSVLLPPLEEQIRIVAKVEELLTAATESRRRLYRVSTLLKRFRQAALEAACSGRLTEDWREQHLGVESASTLAEKIHQSHTAGGFGHGGQAAVPTEDVHTLAAEDLPESWTIEELKFLCKPGRPITYGILKPGPNLLSGVFYVRVADFPNDRLTLSGIRRTSEQIAHSYRRSSLQVGDLLLSIRGTVGRVCKVPLELEGANITQDTARISVHSEVSADYVKTYLRCPSTQKRLESAMKGVAVRGVNIGDVRVLQIALPPRAEQEEIVRRVAALVNLADCIEQRVTAAMVRADKLTQSILAKAFRGELVPTEAELARQEGREYEPASVLLERIREQRLKHDAHHTKPNRKARKASASI